MVTTTGLGVTERVNLSNGTMKTSFDGSLVIFAKPAMKILSSSPQYSIPLMPVQAANLLL